MEPVPSRAASAPTVATGQDLDELGDVLAARHRRATAAGPRANPPGQRRGHAGAVGSGLATTAGDPSTHRPGRPGPGQCHRRDAGPPGRGPVLQAPLRPRGDRGGGRRHLRRAAPGLHEGEEGPAHPPDRRRRPGGHQPTRPTSSSSTTFKRRLQGRIAAGRRPAGGHHAGHRRPFGQPARAGRRDHQGHRPRTTVEIVEEVKEEVTGPGQGRRRKRRSSASSTT